MTKLNIGAITSGAQYAKNLKLAKKLNRKKQLGQLSDVLGAASKLTGGGTAHVGSSSNTDFGKAPIPTGHTEEDFWHPETTESGRVND